MLVSIHGFASGRFEAVLLDFATELADFATRGI